MRKNTSLMLLVSIMISTSAYSFEHTTTIDKTEPANKTNTTKIDQKNQTTAIKAESDQNHTSIDQAKTITPKKETTPSENGSFKLSDSTTDTNNQEQANSKNEKIDTNTTDVPEDKNLLKDEETQETIIQESPVKSNPLSKEQVQDINTTTKNFTKALNGIDPANEAARNKAQANIENTLKSDPSAEAINKMISNELADYQKRIEMMTPKEKAQAKKDIQTQIEKNLKHINDMAKLYKSDVSPEQLNKITTATEEIINKVIDDNTQSHTQKAQTQTMYNQFKSSISSFFKNDTSIGETIISCLAYILVTPVAGILAAMAG